VKSLRTLAGLVLFAAVASLPIAWLLLPEPPPLPALYPMPSFSLTSEQGKPFGAGDLKGKVAIANFIFTSCPTVCPMLTSHMARVQERFAGEPGVHLVSFSVDPKNDTPEVLAAFGRKFGQDPARWTFLTGDLEAVKRAVVEGFKIHVAGVDDPNATAFDIVHGEHFVLVDKNGTIRGYYQPRDLERLGDDAERLLAEELPPKHGGTR